MRFKNIPLVLFLFAFITGMGGTPELSPALPFLQQQRIQPNPTKKLISVRNQTKEIVHYSMKAINRVGEPDEKNLEPGAVDQYFSYVPMDIFFTNNQGKKYKYRLGLGMAYSFRYDENDDLGLYEGAHGRTDSEDLAPFVPTPFFVIERMLLMAEVDKKDIIYDLGCGDGRIVIKAAKKYGAKGVGIDIVPERIKEARAYAKLTGVSHLVTFRQQDVMKSNFSEATIVCLYLLPESNALLVPLFEEQLKPGTLVLSHNYHIPGWEHKEIDYAELVSLQGEEHSIYLYKK
ncbi:MAG: methyltransferase domain-containing protein [Candidatus Aminicenantes bacterium]|nr:methyltransferase domain-containing protein [Candidatus Aminicenantes bacterium]